MVNILPLPVTAEFSLADKTIGAPIAIMGVPFDNVTRSQTLEVIDRMIASRHPHYIATANVDFLVQAQTDVELRRILFDAHLVLCDGTPLVWASRWLGNPLPERVAGSDLVPLLLEAAAKKGYRIFLLGAAEEMNRRAAENIAAKYPGAVVAGRYSPPPATLQAMNHEEIRGRIREANADIVLVAFGCPKQEKWISMNYRELGVPVCVGVGATLDFLAGAVKRAPVWMRSCGLEWTYRLAQEPSRLFGRYMKDLVVFGKGITRQLWSTGSRSKSSSSEGFRAVPVASDARVLVMPERFDAAAVQESRAQWEAQASGETVIADMSGTKFIDSTGVGMLMRLRRLSREQNAAFALANVAPAVWKNIELMKLAEFFPVGPNVDSAWQIAQDAREQTLDTCPIAGGIALQLQGELTESTSEESFAHCAEHLKSVVPGQKITLDLSGVRFIDSSGIAVLVRLRKLVRSFGADVEIANPAPAVANVMRVSGLAALLLNGVACKSE